MNLYTFRTGSEKCLSETDLLASDMLGIVVGGRWRMGARVNRFAGIRETRVCESTTESLYQHHKQLVTWSGVE